MGRGVGGQGQEEFFLLSHYGAGTPLLENQPLCLAACSFIGVFPYRRSKKKAKLSFDICDKSAEGIHVVATQRLQQGPQKRSLFKRFPVSALTPTPKTL